MKIRIAASNIVPSDARTDIQPIICLWKEVEKFFQNYPISVRGFNVDQITTYTLSLDVSEFINFLLEWCNNPSDDFIRQLANKKHWCYLDIYLKRTSDVDNQNPNYLWRFLDLFLQQLYLAMNICLPGSANFYTFSYLDLQDSHYPDLHHLAGLHHEAPTLYCIYFEDVARISTEWNWPKLSKLSFKNVWEWFNNIGLHDLDIATTASQKAVFTLLIISESKSVDVGDIILISQVLENFFVRKGESSQRTLRNRLGMIIGEPKNAQNWVKEFYDLRSRIVHGSYPILRPKCHHENGKGINEYYKDYFLPMVRSVSALIAVIQDLIKTSASEYDFVVHEEVKRKAFVADRSI